MSTIDPVELASRGGLLKPQLDAVPAALKESAQWVVWRLERRGERLTKIPYDAVTGAKASVTDPATWASFEDACAAYGTNDYSGIGVVVTTTDPYAGVDLDDCRDPDSGAITPAAREIVAALDSYAEVSPSGQGLRVFVEAALPPDGRKAGPVEMYETGRFLTITGHRLEDTPATIESRQEALTAVHARVFANRGAKPLASAAHLPASWGQGPVIADDAQLLAVARTAKNGEKFDLLYAGHWQAAGYSSQNEADLALCDYLAFYCGRPDVDRIDRLFRGSGLYRPKWNEQRGAMTYGALTISKAITGDREYYTAPQTLPDEVLQALRDAPMPGGTPVLDDSAALTDEEWDDLFAQVEACANGQLGPPHTAILDPHGRELLSFADAQAPAPIRGRCTDAGNGRRLATRGAGAIRYCYPAGKWFVWNGCIWVPDESGELMRQAKATAKSILAEAALAKDDAELRQALEIHAHRSEELARLKAMVDLAKSELGVPVHPGDFDADPWLLTVQNGTLDLRTGALRPHRRDDLITKLAPVAYDPHATGPTWDAFLAQIIGQDPALIRFLQRVVGYTLTGDIREQILLLLYGTGANGKSTFLETLRALLGDYAVQADFTTFLERKNETVRNDLARLAGARLVSAVEMENGRHLSEAVVKQITGGDTITARFLFREYFDYVPCFKLFLAANHKPEIRGTDNGIWRRIRLIPFEVTIPSEAQDRQLVAKLRAELPGILRWAVEGCLAWQREGLQAPDAVTSATASYREEMDAVGAFLNDCCALEGGARVAVKALYEAYELWCDRNGESPLAKRAFGQRLNERGLAEGRTGSTRYRPNPAKGVGLLLTLADGGWHDSADGAAESGCRCLARSRLRFHAAPALPAASDTREALATGISESEQEPGVATHTCSWTGEITDVATAGNRRRYKDLGRVLYGVSCHTDCKPA